MSPLPHPLLTAHRRLDALWARALQETTEYEELSNGDEITKAIERFVNELCRSPVWAQELKRRAEFLNRASAENSPFSNALTQVKQLKLRNPEPGGTYSSLTIQRVRELRSRLKDCEDLDAIRPTLDRMLDEQLVSEGDIHVVKNLAHLCKRLLHDAKRDECDGCSDLYDCYQATEPGAELMPKVIRVCVGNVRGLIEPMKAAADSLMDWAARNMTSKEPEGVDVAAPLSGTGRKLSRETSKVRSSKPRGGKKVDAEVVQFEEELAEEWRRAHATGGYKPDFANDKGMTVGDLNRLLNRVTKRIRRSDKPR